MAVYTHLSDEEMQALIGRYAIGQLEQATGIAEGVENSNYLVQTSQKQFILTIFEQRVDTDALPYYLGFMEHLAGRGIACPEPVHAKDGSVVQTLASGKKAAMVSFLEGRSIFPEAASKDQFREVGELTARLHLAGKGFPLKRANGMSVAGWRKLYEKTATRADEVEPGLSRLIGDELHYLVQAWPVAQIPSGAVHADLFPDNIFFADGRLSGVIDFYFACNDAFAYDLAITLNAWCFDREHSFNKGSAQALFAGYEAVRTLTEAERRYFPVLARGAALRFLLSRLHDWLYPVTGALVTAKNPMEYVCKLRFHQDKERWEDYGL